MKHLKKKDKLQQTKKEILAKKGEAIRVETQGRPSKDKPLSTIDNSLKQGIDAPVLSTIDKTENQNRKAHYILI